MGLPPKLTKFNTPSQAIASYNYTDVADGTGGITLYGKKAENGSFLSTISQASADSGIKTGTFNLDLTPFNITRTAMGTAELFFVARGTGDNSNYSARIYHYDGSTETAISSTETTANVSDDPWELLLRFSLTEKLFRKGDILRLKMYTGSMGIHLTSDKPLILNMSFKLDL